MKAQERTMKTTKIAIITALSFGAAMAVTQPALAKWETSDKVIDPMTDEASRAMAQQIDFGTAVALKCWDNGGWNLVIITSDRHPAGVELDPISIRVRVGDVTESLSAKRNNHQGRIVVQAAISTNISTALKNLKETNGKMAFDYNNIIHKVDLVGFKNSMTRMIETCE
jgi:uncharacterized membrane protein